MNIYHSNKLKTGIILIIIFALFTNGMLFKKAFQSYFSYMRLIGKDEITLYEKRFEELIKMLPSYGIVGYIDDKKAYGYDVDSGNLKDLLLTQYSISPVIIDPTKDYRLVIGNFPETVTASNVSVNKNLILIKDFGNGVMLFRTE